MKTALHNELKRRSREEPYAKLLGLSVREVSEGVAVVRMRATEDLKNIFGSTHGGALFSLIDEAFQLACNSHGILAVALNVSITYAAAPALESLLEARASEMHKTSRTASYLCEVREVEGGRLVAVAHALAYRTGKKPEFEPQRGALP
jgi:acyl-CoA thioesterase